MNFGKAILKGRKNDFYHALKHEHKPGQLTALNENPFCYFLVPGHK